MDAAEFNQRSQAILDRMDKSLSRLDQRGRVPVSLVTRDRIAFPVDMSLCVCLPMLAGVLAWQAMPSLGLPAVGFAAVTMVGFKDLRLDASRKLTSLLIKACGRAIPATVLELGFLNNAGKMPTTTPARIVEAIKRYLDPDKANAIPVSLDSPTVDHALVIDRALFAYGELTQARGASDVVTDRLKDAGLIDEANAMISSRKLLAVVAPVGETVPECAPSAPAPRRF